MASAGFGRKVTAAAPSPDADLAARREAFLAAERARRASQSESVPSGGGFATGATGYGKARSAQPAAAAVSGPFFVREKSLATAYLLWFFLGGFSAHRFYLGYTVSAGIQLFLRFGGAIAFVGSATTKSGGIASLGLMMFAAGWLWMLIDGFLIPGMRRNANRTATTAPAYVFA